MTILAAPPARGILSVHRPRPGSPVPGLIETGARRGWAHRDRLPTGVGGFTGIGARRGRGSPGAEVRLGRRVRRGWARRDRLAHQGRGFTETGARRGRGSPVRTWRQLAPRGQGSPGPVGSPGSRVHRDRCPPRPRLTGAYLASAGSPMPELTGTGWLTGGRGPPGAALPRRHSSRAVHASSGRLRPGSGSARKQPDPRRPRHRP